MQSTRTVTSALLLGAMISFTAAAQGYPEKAVRVVVPFPAGGAADIVARHVTTRLATVIGQQVIVDNRGGAGGIIGGENIARSPADGYNLLFASSSVLSINPHLGAKASYDVLTSFTPIVQIGHAPNVLGSHRRAILCKGREHVKHEAAGWVGQVKLGFGDGSESYAERTHPPEAL